MTCSHGRGVVAAADAVRRGGIALGSIYLANDSVGEASQRALVEIGDALVAQGRPRVHGGDFNAAPRELRAKAGRWLEAVQGVIAQSAGGETCFQAAAPPTSTTSLCTAAWPSPRGGAARSLQGRSGPVAPSGSR